MHRKILSILLIALLTVGVFAHDEDDVPVESDENTDITPSFDLATARIVRFGETLIFYQTVYGTAGDTIPEPTGELAGAEVYSYVWPTSLDSSVVGFEAEQGILALAVTSHPDFDDTPLADENGDGDTGNDGGIWHSHWVVLVPDEACESGGLKVRDIPEGETPTLPDTWPQLPILIDSPDYPVDVITNEVVAWVPHENVDYAEAFQFDGVTAGLQVNASIHDPLLCVVNIYDVASGDLSLPGTSR